MEIRHVEFEHQLILTINNEQIRITTFLTDEPGNIKLGIDAPGILVNREEVYKRKLEHHQPEQSDKLSIDYSKKVQEIFTRLNSITHKSEKLETAAKKLFDKDKILTPKSINKIACGEMNTTKWIITCAIDVLITERALSVKKVLSPDELYQLWAKPLLNHATDYPAILNKARLVNDPILIEKIIHRSKSLK
ncbi:hypothetical protein [Legionella sp. km535]|uniref:hypothetical protein n=1 Tax=Legionella sp. km535 TaxID=2498107 RepID=UPI0018F6C6AF|nr:hypothetical protein [Legionella sp. km535]